MAYMKKMSKGGGSLKGDCAMTGSLVKGKSCSAGVTRAKHSAVVTFPVGFTHSRRKVRGKKK